MRGSEADSRDDRWLAAEAENYPSGSNRRNDEPVSLTYEYHRIVEPSDIEPDLYTADPNEIRERDLVGFHIIGPCPRCHDRTSALCATKYLLVQKQEPAKKDHVTLDRTMTTALKCACIEYHAKAESGTFGCGAEWLLQVDYEYDEHEEWGVVSFRSVEKEHAQMFWANADAEGEAIPGVLTTAQDTAKTWQGALTAIVGLVGVGSLILGRDTLHSFELFWQWAFGIGLVLAVVFNGLVLWTSNVACVGYPAWRRWQKKSPPKADLAPLIEARKSEQNLLRSLIFGGLTLLASLFVVGVMLFAPTTPSH